MAIVRNICSQAVGEKKHLEVNLLQVGIYELKSVSELQVGGMVNAQNKQIAVIWKKGTIGEFG